MYGVLYRVLCYMKLKREPYERVRKEMNPNENVEKTGKQ